MFSTQSNDLWLKGPNSLKNMCLTKVLLKRSNIANDDEDYYFVCSNNLLSSMGPIKLPVNVNNSDK